VAEFISLVTLFAIAIAVLYILDLQQGTKNYAKTEPVWIYAEFITEVLTVVFLAPSVLYLGIVVHSITRLSCLRLVAGTVWDIFYHPEGM
jgi:hypothetical protein